MGQSKYFIYLFILLAFFLQSCEGQAQKIIDTTRYVINKCDSLFSEDEICEVIELKVIKIVDGDTFDGLTQDKRQIRIRLAAFDAPEKGQPYGNNAKKQLSELIFGKNVIAVMNGKQHYSRMIAKVYTTDSIDVVSKMLSLGMGWHFKRFDQTELYEQKENEARNAKVGLWHEDAHTPIEPWVWRKMTKEERDLFR